MARLRRILDGTGPFSGLAIACWLVGLVWFSTILMSSNGVNWWLNTHSVRGRETDGLVYYSVGGVHYTLNDPQSFPGSRPRTVTAYYLPSDPGDATLHNTATQVLDWGLTVGPGALGLGLFAAGFVKRRGRSRRPELGERADSFGHGIPAETIRALMPPNQNLGA